MDCLQKSMKSHRRSEHCILSSVAFMLAGVRSTLALARYERLEELLLNQSNRRICLEHLDKLRYFPLSHNIRYDT